MDAQDIARAIAAGEIEAITLDTSVFGDPNSTSLETPQLRRLEQFKGGRISFVLSNVVELEVVAHLKKLAEDAQSSLGRAFRLLEQSWRIPRNVIDDAEKNLIGDETPTTVVQQRLNAFKERTACVVIKAEEHARIDELVKRYFSHEAPFSEKAEKKHEFPDALALLSLEAWARSNGTKVLVVSRDGDWINFCTGSECLIHVQTLREALGLFHQDASVVCDILSQGLQRGDYPDTESSIESAIEQHIEGMDFIPDGYTGYAHYIDPEILDISIKSFSIGQNGETFTPLDMVTDEYLVAEIPVSVELEITSQFTFSTQDGFDKDYFVIGSTELMRSEHLELQAIVTFSGKAPDELRVDEVEIEGPSRLSIDYGEVNPDWS